jgi:protease I
MHKGPDTLPRITDARIAILATNGSEQSELEIPLDKLKQAGATVHVVTPDGEAIKGWDKTDWGREMDAAKAVSDVEVSDYDALVLPGDQTSPDLLRINADAVALVRDFVADGRFASHGAILCPTAYSAFGST